MHRANNRFGQKLFLRDSSENWSIIAECDREMERNQSRKNNIEYTRTTNGVCACLLRGEDRFFVRHSDRERHFNSQHCKRCCDIIPIYCGSKQQTVKNDRIINADSQVKIALVFGHLRNWKFNFHSMASFRFLSFWIRFRMYRFTLPSHCHKLQWQMDF